MIEKYIVYDADGKYMGEAPIMEQAVGAARKMAARDDAYYDVERIRITDKDSMIRRVRYHPDGTVEQLWKQGDPERREPFGERTSSGMNEPCR